MKRVAMFVTNPCSHDARVMKEAKSLADNNYLVRVFALANAFYPPGIYQQENYTVHRLAFDNVFKRVQNKLWNFITLLFSPLRYLVKSLSSLVRSLFSVIITLKKNIVKTVSWLVLTPLIGVSFLLLGCAYLLAPLAPKLSEYLRNIASKYRAKSSKGIVSSELSPQKNSVQLLALWGREKRAGIYLYLKRNYAFSVRKQLQRIVRVLWVLVFKSYRILWLSYRLSYRLFKKVCRLIKRTIKITYSRYIRRPFRLAYSKIYSFTVRTRRRIVAKVNRLTYIVLLPFHKLTTYFFFCNTAAKHAMAWQPDIAHAHDLNTLYAAKKIKETINAKVVYDSHELWVHRNRVGRKATLEAKFDSIVERKLIPSADAIITVCDSIGEWLVDRYEGIPTPVILRNMPHKLPQQSKSTSDLTLKVRLGISEKNYVMIYTGKITSGRGIGVGLSALAQTPNLHFVLLGYGEESYVEKIHQQISELGVSNRVSFCDPVPHHEVTKFIAGADFALVYIEPICLSYEYALPNKLFESIQAGIPILGSKLVEIEKIVEGHGVGLCFSSAEDLAAKIKIGFNSDKLEEWRNAIKLCQAKLCWDVEQVKLIDLYGAL